MSLTTRHFRKDEPIPINRKVEDREKARLKAVPDPTDKMPPGEYSLETFETAIDRVHRAKAYGRHEQGLRHCAELAEAEGNKEEAARARLAIAAINDAEEALNEHPKEAA